MKNAEEKRTTQTHGNGWEDGSIKFECKERDFFCQMIGGFLRAWEVVLVVECW